MAFLFSLPACGAPAPCRFNPRVSARRTVRPACRHMRPACSRLSSQEVRGFAAFPGFSLAHSALSGYNGLIQPRGRCVQTEHWEWLKAGGYRFLWDDALFRPGTDSFLLSSLPRLNPGMRVCDLGCGTGLLGLLLLQRQPELHVSGMDIQAAAVSLANRAAAENGLSGRADFRVGDLRQSRVLFPAGSFDLVVCNPPYYPVGSGKTAAQPARRQARAETDASLPEICAAAAGLLRWGGKFCLVHKPERLGDVVCALREGGMELKRLRFVHPRAGAAPSLLLAEGCRGGRPGVQIEPPLLLQTEDGAPSPELDVIYFRSSGGL